MKKYFSKLINMKYEVILHVCFTRANLAILEKSINDSFHSHRFFYLFIQVLNHAYSFIHVLCFISFLHWNMNWLWIWQTLITFK